MYLFYLEYDPSYAGFVAINVDQGLKPHCVICRNIANKAIEPPILLNLGGTCIKKNKFKAKKNNLQKKYWIKKMTQTK